MKSMAVVTVAAAAKAGAQSVECRYLTGAASGVVSYCSATPTKAMPTNISQGLPTYDEQRRRHRTAERSSIAVEQASSRDSPSLVKLNYRWVKCEVTR